MVVDGVMRPVPHPEKTVHDILVREPGHELPEQKRSDHNQCTQYNGYNPHDHAVF